MPVSLLLASAVGLCLLSFGPSVLWHSAGPAQALGLLAPRGLSAAEPGCLAAHETNDAMGRFRSRGPARTVVPERAENCRSGGPGGEHEPVSTQTLPNNTPIHH